jgi:DNA-binding response OmpR family regulator
MRAVEGASATTIVVVEDEAAIADALAARLRAGGFAGADAVRAVQGIGYAFGTPEP